MPVHRDFPPSCPALLPPGRSRRGFSLLARCFRFVGLVLAVALCVGGSSARGDEAGEEFFENHIRPLLVERCAECHGQEPSGSLRITSRQSLLVGGDSGPAIDPENLSQSLLLLAVRDEGGLEMPPEEPLSEREIELLTQWVRMGAPWPEHPGASSGRDALSAGHWAFQAVHKPNVPEVETPDWVRTPVDAFVLARLESEGLAPAPEADRRTLLRRVSYALTGLPPSPEEVARFEADVDPLAYERLVEQLLNSPHFGEHWARHWLDAARYSDTKGYVYAREERFWPHAWAYRDWVVRAFNEDLPYNEFLLLQLAADQVPNAAEDDRAAMGFLTIGRRFLGVKHDVLDDRIDVVTRGTMGLTVSCARCHNHKYDPIPTADYYSFYGVFDNCVERLVPTREPRPGEEAFWKELTVRQDALSNKMAESRKTASDRVRGRLADYLTAQTELGKYPAEGFDQIFAAGDLLPGFVRRWERYLWDAERTQDPVFVAWHAFYTLEKPRFAEQAEEVTRALKALPNDKINPLVREKFATPPADFGEVIQRYAELLSAIDQQWQAAVTKATEAEADPPTMLAEPAAEQLRHVLYGPGAPCEVPDEPIMRTETLFDSATTTELWRLQAEVERWIIQHEQSIPFAVILEDRSAFEEPRIFRRGNPLQKGPVVARQFLEVLAGADRKPFAEGSGRLEMAEAIIDPENPLTSRVMVNRVWTHLIGQGLVDTPSDFGLRAERPSHPELLDWMAATFVEEGWSVKKLMRSILLSSTFRQSSTSGFDGGRGQQVDPNNRLLWRMNPHRLSFEEFRDSMLAASGELQVGIGGRPKSLFDSPFPARRTLYGLVDRQFLPGTLRVFDFANPDLHIPKRNETTVPQQALFFLNHPFALEQSRRLADRVSESPSDEEAVRRMFQEVLQRDPSPREIEESRALVARASAEEAAPVSRTSQDWEYGYGSVDEAGGRVASFTPLPHFTGSAWQGGEQYPDGKLGWVQLSATGGHPGNDRQHAAIRRWRAPETTRIQIVSELAHEVAAGDGVRAFIVSSTRGILQTAHAHQKTAVLNVESLEVAAGETVDFVVDIGDVLNSDQYLWKVDISPLGEDSKAAVAWDSIADFPADSTPRLTPWQQLAQVLMCTNEFLFVD